jgi:integrase/recombinase XerD
MDFSRHSRLPPIIDPARAGRAISGRVDNRAAAPRPLRKRNFAAIHLGHQLLCQGGRYWLVFSPEETKTGQPWEAVFAEPLLPWLARYLDHHRPVLLRGEHGTDPADTDALWVSEVGTQLELGALGRRIRKHTARLPPH